MFYHQDSNLASCSGGFLWHFCGRLRSGLQLWRCRRNLETEIPECGCGYTLHIPCLVNDMMLYFLAIIWEVKYINHWDQGLLTRCAVWPTAETSSLSTPPWTPTHVTLEFRTWVDYSCKIILTINIFQCAQDKEAFWGGKPDKSCEWVSHLKTSQFHKAVIFNDFFEIFNWKLF